MIGPGKVAAAIRMAIFATAVVVLAPAGASAAVTSERVNIDEDAIMTGDAANDTIIISSNGTNLTHNRFAAGDPGFASAQDFDTTDPGDQTVLDGLVNNIFLDAGDGNDTLQVGLSPGSPASTVDATIGVQGQGGTDTLIVDDFTDPTDRTVEPSISGFSVGTGFGGGRIDYPSFDIESMLLLFGSGDDTARIGAATPSFTNVAMNTGDDTIRFTDGASMGQAQMGPGVGDTLDYSQRSDNILVFPPNGRSFSANLDGTQEVPPNPGTSAFGIARATINSSTNNLTSFLAAVFGITTDGTPGTTMLTDSHIHGPAPVGVSAGILEPLGTVGWTNTGVGGMTRVQTSNQAIDQATDDAMVAGNSYLNVHTDGMICGPGSNADCGTGEIRGQLIPDGFTADATGTQFAEGFENVIGGSGDDQLFGTPAANAISGGEGDDLIEGADGGDTLHGDGGADEVRGQAGADQGGAAGVFGDAGDDEVDGGAGNDTVNGGADTDTAVFASATQAVTASLLGGTATNDGTGAQDAFSQVENLTGTAFGDDLTGDGSSNTLQGAAGNDTLTGDDGADTLEGGPNDDLLQADNGAADADAALICGTGNDFVDRDPPPTDPDSIVAADCETVNPPLQPDADGDGVPDTTDNCVDDANPGQENTDGDALGDACDPDDDNDGGADGADNCPAAANADQANNDGDAQGDVCDADDDNDGDNDGADNCPTAANADQANTDGDAQGDACDADDDNDTINDGADNCPVNANANQANADGDAQGDACDADDDNDTVPDASDACPTQAGPASNNGCPLPAVPPDGDGDGVPDASDACPTQAGPASNNGCPVTTKPDNDIEIDKAKLNTKKGSAKLPVEVPGAGQLELSGKNVKPVAKQASGSGTVDLKVKPKGKLADKLDDKGKAKVTLEVTFTPTGGDPNTESTKITLKEK